MCISLAIGSGRVRIERVVRVLSSHLPQKTGRISAPAEAKNPSLADVPQNSVELYNAAPSPSHEGLEWIGLMLFQ